MKITRRMLVRCATRPRKYPAPSNSTTSNKLRKRSVGRRSRAPIVMNFIEDEQPGDRKVAAIGSSPQSEIRNSQMSEQLRKRLFNELDSIRLIDPHSHIEPKTAASKTLADILGYHYYTELCHSAGMPRAAIEEPGIDPKEKVRRLVERIEPLRNTIQYSWLLELAREFFDFPEGEDLRTSNWEKLCDTASKRMSEPNWETQVLDKTKLDAIFL